MNRRNSGNDETLCIICDLWWLWLLIFVLIITAVLTRDYWLPLLGVDRVVEPNPIPSVVIPTIAAATPRSTNPVAVPSATSAVLVPTVENPPAPTASGPLGVGSTAPNFTLPRLGGGEISLSELSGQPVLLVFFASFDSFSQAEAATLRQLGERYGDQLVILPINIAYNDLTEDVRTFVNDYEWAFPVAMDETGSVMALYERNSIPAHIFIDPSGVIVAMEGILTEEQLEQKVSDLAD